MTSSTSSTMTTSATYTTSSHTFSTSATSTTTIIPAISNVNRAIMWVVLIVFAILILAFAIACMWIQCWHCPLARVAPRPESLREPRPPKPPVGRKGLRPPAPAFAPMTPCNRSPGPPLVVLVQFQGAPRITPRVTLVPASSPWPQAATRHECSETQPSHARLPSPEVPFLASLPQFRTKICVPDLCQDPAPLERIPTAPPTPLPAPPSITWLEPLARKSPRPWLRIQVVLHATKPPQRPASRSQPRQELVPGLPPGWPPADAPARRESEPLSNQPGPGPDALKPPRQLPRWGMPDMLCHRSREREEPIEYPASPCSGKELRHVQLSPAVPVLLRLEPASRPAEDPPPQSLQPAVAAERLSEPCEPRVQLIPVSHMVLTNLRFPADLPLPRDPQP
ncbi:unnamed protein product [Symbiodinium natans]|uniref:Uncharacterized protein n=1 Tax=Symbiodinium natans TaxID=878477 RepID=A0A812U479_9DINO|nr:unnamed protein product [Symbiodinium natans]